MKSLGVSLSFGVNLFLLAMVYYTFAYRDYKEGIFVSVAFLLSLLTTILFKKVCKK